MPDALLAERPTTLPAPGSTFPEIKFRAETLKVTITVNFEMRTADEVERVKEAVESAVHSLRCYAARDAGGSPAVTVNHVQG